MGKPIGVTLVFLLFLATAHPQSLPRFALLEVGEYHGSDVSLEQPGTWIGVFCQEKVCLAKESKVRAARVTDPLVDEEKAAPTGTSVEVLTAEKPLFLVRGVAPAPGPIQAVFVGEQNLAAGDEQKFAFGGRGFALRVEGNKTLEESLPKGSNLVLAGGEITQTLFSLPDGGDEPYITVLWIGDLDGDGKPDLLLNTSRHYNVAHKVLWLSSIARAGQLVGQAAVFETTGC